VLSVFAQQFGLERDIALRISQGFGAGIAYTDDICGAVSGAIMVVGLRYGRVTADDKTAKEKTYAVVGEFPRNLSSAIAQQNAQDCSDITCQTSNRLQRQKRTKSSWHDVRPLSGMQLNSLKH
jgi:C_GCAxxG_C_C family probable redox protein